MQIKLGRSLVILVGASGSGKSTWAKNNFSKDEIISMDDIREIICGNFMDQSQNNNVAKIFHSMIDARLSAGNRVVADATHLNMNHLYETMNIGKQWNANIYIVVIERPIEEIEKTAGWRNDIKSKGMSFIQRQQQIFKSIKPQVMKINDNHVQVSGSENIEVCHQSDSDEFTVIGDIHGDINELYAILDQNDGPYVFLGDLTDGTNYPDKVIQTVHDLVATGQAYFIRGNHDIKLHKVLSFHKSGKTFRGSMNHGLHETFSLIKDDDVIINKFMNLYAMGYQWLHIGNTLFVHGAAHPKMTVLYGKNPSAYPMIQMATYGETDGTTNEAGYPNRTYEWVDRMTCNVYVGHDVRSTIEPMVVKTPRGGQVTFMDTGCGKPDHKATGGHLSALRINIHEHP